MYSFSKAARYGESEIALYGESADPHASVLRGRFSVLLSDCFFKIPFSGAAARGRLVGICNIFIKQEWS